MKSWIVNAVAEYRLLSQGESTLDGNVCCGCREYWILLAGGGRGSCAVLTADKAAVVVTRCGRTGRTRSVTI